MSERLTWTDPPGPSPKPEFLWSSFEPPSRERTDADCTDLARIFLTDSFIAGCRPWRYYRISRRDRAVGGAEICQVPVAIRPVGGSLALEGPVPSSCELHGRLIRLPGKIGVIAEVTGPSVPGDLHRLAPVAAIRWPPGLAGIGRTTEQSLAGGTLWTHSEREDGPRGPHSSDPYTYWPFLVRSWSDGHLWVMSIGTGWVEGCGTLPATGPDPHCDFLADPGGWGWGSTRGLRRWTLATDPFDYVAPDLAAYGRYTAYVGPQAAPVAKSARLRFLTSDELARAANAPVPEAVRPYWEAPDGLTCPTVTLRGDPVVGDATVGLAAIAPFRDTPGYRMQAAALQGKLVQWTLMQDAVALTYFRGLEADPGHPGDSAKGYGYLRDYERGAADDECRASGRMLQWLLPLEPQRWFRFLPQKWEKRPEGYWWTLKLLPDTEVGLLRKIRVGNTPWGRATVWSDPAIGHFVFDLREPSP
jgi:hypothetical protein